MEKNQTNINKFNELRDIIQDFNFFLQPKVKQYKKTDFFKDNNSTQYLEADYVSYHKNLLNDFINDLEFSNTKLNIKNLKKLLFDNFYNVLVQDFERSSHYPNDYKNWILELHQNKFLPLNQFNKTTFFNPLFDEQNPITLLRLSFCNYSSSLKKSNNSSFIVNQIQAIGLLESLMNNYILEQVKNFLNLETNGFSHDNFKNYYKIFGDAYTSVNTSSNAQKTLAFNLNDYIIQNLDSSILNNKKLSSEIFSCLKKTDNFFYTKSNFKEKLFSVMENNTLEQNTNLVSSFSSFSFFSFISSSNPFIEFKEEIQNFIINKHRQLFYEEENSTLFSKKIIFKHSEKFLTFPSQPMLFTLILDSNNTNIPAKLYSKTQDNVDYQVLEFITPYELKIKTSYLIQLINEKTDISNIHVFQKHFFDKLYTINSQIIRTNHLQNELLHLDNISYKEKSTTKKKKI